MITGLDFAERLYSSGEYNIYVIQKEFGIKQKLINNLKNSINLSRTKKIELEKLKKS